MPNINSAMPKDNEKPKFPKTFLQGLVIKPQQTLAFFKRKMKNKKIELGNDERITSKMHLQPVSEPHTSKWGQLAPLEYINILKKS